MNERAAVGVLEAKPPAFSESDAGRLAREVFGIVATLHPLESERDQNFRLRADDGREYVLKIANPAEDPAVVDFQLQALRHVALRDPGLPVPRVCTTLDGASWRSVAGPDGRPHAVRMVTYLPGQRLADVPHGPRLLRDLGVVVARLGRALRGFFHPAAGHELLWDLKHAARLRAYLADVEGADRRRLAERVLDRFEAKVLPVLPGLRAQVIHADANEYNVLVDPGDRERIAGVVDFGDMVHSALVNDLAVAAASVIPGEPDPLADAGTVVAGYHAVTPLAEEEIALLFDLTATRLVASVLISAWRSKLHPENVAYIAASDASEWSTLERIDRTNRELAHAGFRAACGLAPPRPKPPDGAVEGLLERRSRLLGPALRLFYERPLHIVRGEGAWLFDASGRAYLDAYNNVAHLGHCHPEVVAALARQAATLNTNTRYLHDAILEYAERLTATMPGDLRVCMFTCTGSEAVDLAWRLAKAHTGADGALVTEDAYHGNTDAVSALSPGDLPEGRLAPHVATVPPPDDYRGPHRRGEPGLGERYAAHVDAAIEALRSRGHAPAAFLCDPMFSSSGILVPPEGYLRAAFQKVRAAGGVCIADEVQVGFGRIGAHRWGFEAQEVTPDIVTLGKPIGNGHPLAAVVTTPAIARSFANHGEYFNTFGGNPVSCAVGLAVLEVLERERLRENAGRVGSHMKKRLQALARKSTLVGDVRGAGLFLGVELVRDRATLEPAADEARAVVDRMRDEGVLIGLEGPLGNVLKIRPPMVFTEADADRLVETLDRVLAGRGGT